ncbi:hypothetical protein HanRHA438_Chr01g0002101 [Helianthus annuus]|uniref:Uncharacterized protein n=1 Tax=Helianthus annuus TaxID=4232 RepID=A0A9K3JTS7_HELAN|nr:hypothetical protein HanXRQr2_Chr01g0001911 [Helianthus annuus]KAJ0946262.1 hypothetical protein HanRHA438_Chr01g0002101 [Helianthus annuus]KAJ0955339.1 hypothetical protein HanPSC8_Chr01g0001761 [Helianthus annuus]
MAVTESRLRFTAAVVFGLGSNGRSLLRAWFCGGLTEQIDCR